MANGIISTFGNYDFFGKSLPGMVFVTCVIGFLPDGSVPLPQTPTNFLSSVSFILVIFVLGTLSGEIVHSTTNTFENVIAWFGRIIRRIIVGIAECLNLAIRPPEPKIAIRRDSSDNSDRPLIRNNSIYRWIYSKYTDIVYLLWTHRKIFREKITSQLEDPYQKTEKPVPKTTFTQHHTIDKAINEFGIEDDSDIDSVYTVIVSIVSQSNYNRPFKFQSRYAFCRSMWIVFTVVWVGSIFLMYPPPEWIVPDALHYSSYIKANLSKSEIGAISYILVATSLEFASATSAYKRYYIEYIFSAIYAIDGGAVGDENKMGE